ncbi:sensor histidine kinase [Ureibacillus acetophenoni]|uniref:histidine kinase n=1 Tax=Ureibacillus acetophenoni TaxID=614649 RepID=A0A285UIA1_9BACL|nr:sensor histidine kinase [Ureibacillus acetophenoni]SOC41417.1 sensor histidine kinase regulating citrate/malate metabolism [Ureibacillus acetophenoni]
MKKSRFVTLKVKILGLVILLISLIIASLTLMFIYIQLNEDKVKAEKLSLQTAKALSYMPALHESYQLNRDNKSLDQFIEHVKSEVEPMTFFIQNRDGSILAWSDDKDRNRTFNIEESSNALIFGSYYVIQTKEDDKTFIKAVAPIKVDYGDYYKIEGAVVVLFDLANLYSSIWDSVKKVLNVSLITLLIGIIGSYLLSNSIRKDTLNLEPYEIATMFRERNAILQSVKEGILAVDKDGWITMMNSSAHYLLDIENQAEGMKLSNVIESNELLEIISSNEKSVNVEMQYNEKIMIINTQPIVEDGMRIGTVASFRDRTEIKHMIDALSEVKQYSDDLRAQSHEYSNKLYAILGLLQLNKKEEAIELIKSETQLYTINEDLIFTKIQDERVQAILLGKIAQASEKKIEFVIDEESTLTQIPQEIPTSSLIVILGNLINNAFDAVKEKDEKKVSFFVTDIGNDIIFEVYDNGKGIQKEIEHQIFQKGLSSKGKNRGFGLFNVKIEVESLKGFIEYSSELQKGTVFTVYLPKGES